MVASLLTLTIVEVSTLGVPSETDEVELEVEISNPDHFVVPVVVGVGISIVEGSPDTSGVGVKGNVSESSHSEVAMMTLSGVDFETVVLPSDGVKVDIDDSDAYKVIAVSGADIDTVVLHSEAEGAKVELNKSDLDRSVVSMVTVSEADIETMV